MLSVCRATFAYLSRGLPRQLICITEDIYAAADSCFGDKSSATIFTVSWHLGKVAPSRTILFLLEKCCSWHLRQGKAILASGNYENELLPLLRAAVSTPGQSSEVREWNKLSFGRLETRVRGKFLRRVATLLEALEKAGMLGPARDLVIYGFLVQDD